MTSRGPLVKVAETSSRLESAVRSSGGDLKLANVRSTYCILGPTRADDNLLPGDRYCLSFDIEGITVDETGKVRYSVAVDVARSGATQPTRGATRPVAAAPTSRMPPSASPGAIRPGMRPTTRARGHAAPAGRRVQRVLWLTAVALLAAVAAADTRRAGTAGPGFPVTCRSPGLP